MITDHSVWVSKAVERSLRVAGCTPGVVRKGVIAALAEYGRSQNAWRGIKAGIAYGHILMDGRAA